MFIYLNNKTYGVCITIQPKEKARLIKLFECKFWMSESHVPVGSESSFLSVIAQASTWQAANGHPPLIAHCQ